MAPFWDSPFFVGSLLLSLLCFLKFLFFPSTRLPLRGTSQAAGTVFLSGSLLLSLLCFLKFLLFPSTRSGRAGPLLSAPAESRQRQAQGSFTPLRIPGPKWGAGRPPLETPKSSLARQTWPNSSPLRGWSFGAVGESASACALATAAAPPPLRGGGFAPLPPRSQTGKARRSCANAHGTTFETAFAATPSQISRKLLPRSG